MKAKVLLIISVLLAAVLATASCERDNFDEEFLNEDNICLKVRGKVIFDYDPLTCQMSYYSAEKVFRAGSDTMSDFFTIKLSAAPTESGQTVTGAINWTTDTSNNKMENVSFKIARKDANGRVWLWSSFHDIYAVMDIIL